MERAPTASSVMVVKVTMPAAEAVGCMVRGAEFDPSGKSSHALGETDGVRQSDDWQNGADSFLHGGMAGCSRQVRRPREKKFTALKIFQGFGPTADIYPIAAEIFPK